MLSSEWLPGWDDYCDKNYHRVEIGERDQCFQVNIARVDDAAFGEQYVDIESLLIQRTVRNCFLTEAPLAFRGQLDLTNRTLGLEVLAHAESPHLILSNALRSTVSLALPLCFDGLMFHASSGILDNQGVFFPGISTAGKTTLALGFKKVTYLSDDITLTRDLEKSPTLSASPFFGIAGRKGANEEAPLAAVGLLVSKNPQETKIKRMSTKDALRELMRHVICWSQDAELQGTILSHVSSLVQQVPVFAVERYIGDSSDTVMERVLEAAAKCR